MPRDTQLNTIIALASKIQRRLPKQMLLERLKTLKEAIDAYLRAN